MQGRFAADVPKARRQKSKPARSDDGQLELTDQSRLEVSARAIVDADPADEDGEFETPPRRLRDRLWNALAGLSLVPFAWIFTSALFHTFMKAKPGSHRVPFWMSHEFLMFGLGAGLWLLWLCASYAIWKRPRPVRAYVLGHELMHMLMARVFRGKVSKFHVGAEGGYIVTNKYNFLIALAPYLWPFYSVPVLAAWGISFFWKDVPYMREGFLAALGFTWMFHLTFTLWVLPRGQSDLHGPGRVFSITVIYLANAILLGGVLVVLAPEVSWHAYGRELWASTLAFYQWAGDAFAKCVGLLSYPW
ncbi:MAG: hypothetical protein ABI318_16665, partial [Chthoniobacteraceae bacterium]